MLEEKLNVGILLKDTSSEVVQNSLVKDIAHYVNDYKLDVFLGPEWIFMPPKRVYTASEKNKIIQKLSQKINNKNALIIPGSIMWEDEKLFYNTSPLISKGGLIGEYHKHQDGGDVLHASFRNCRKKMYSRISHKVFKWKGYRVGVEICADQGELGGFLEDTDKPLLDLYFLVSCGAYLSTGWAPLKNGGYGLNSDGDDYCSRVIQRKEDAYNRLVKVNKSKQKEGCLDLYDIVMQKNKRK